MLVRKISVQAPANNLGSGASDSSPSTHAPLLNHFLSNSEAQNHGQQSASLSLSPAVVRTTTVIELGRKAFVIQRQPDVSLGDPYNNHGT